MGAHERMPWPLRKTGVHQYQRPLEQAILNEGVAEVERLINLGAPVTADYYLDAARTDAGNALDLALLARRYKLASQMLNGVGGDALAQGSTRALAWASRDGQPHLLREMLQHGASASQKDEEGRSALLLATMRGHRPCVEALLAAGAWRSEEKCQEVQEWSVQMKIAGIPEP